MRFLIALTAAFVLAAAGVARADDCEPEGNHGNSLSPVALTHGGAVVIQGAFLDDGASLDATLDQYFLGRDGFAAATHDGADPLSPSLVHRPDGSTETVMWQRGAIVAQTRDGDVRAIAPGVSFPGDNGLAAGEGPDGTITLLYFAHGNAVVQRVAPNGSAGVPIVVASVDQDGFLPLLTVDAAGTAFGQFHAAVVHWPASGPPQLLAVPETPLPLVADQHDGAWQAVDARSLGHVTAAGERVVRVASDTQPVVDHQGDAIVAWSHGDRTHIQRVTAEGVVDDVSVLRSHIVESVALDPRTGDPWVLAHIGRTLVAQGPGKTLVLRGRRGYSEDGASLAIDASGRAWALWDEASDRLDEECHLFPAHERVRWATFGLHARHVSDHVLSGAFPPE